MRSRCRACHDPGKPLSSHEPWTTSCRADWTVRFTGEGEELTVSVSRGKKAVLQSLIRSSLPVLFGWPPHAVQSGGFRSVYGRAARVGQLFELPLRELGVRSVRPSLAGRQPPSLTRAADRGMPAAVLLWAQHYGRPSALLRKQGPPRGRTQRRTAGLDSSKHAWQPTGRRLLFPPTVVCFSLISSPPAGQPMLTRAVTCPRFALNPLPELHEAGICQPAYLGCRLWVPHVPSHPARLPALLQHPLHARVGQQPAEHRVRQHLHDHAEP